MIPLKVFLEEGKPGHQGTNIDKPHVLFLRFFLLSRWWFFFPFSGSTAAGSIPEIATPAYQPLGSRGGGVDGRADVKVEDWFACGFGVGRVIVDHVADLFGRAVGLLTGDVPIVPVEGRLGTRRDRVGNVSIGWKDETSGRPRGMGEEAGGTEPRRWRCESRSIAVCLPKS